MDHNSKVYVAGHKGLVGSALMRRLKECGYENLITRTHRQLDLTDSRRVISFFKRERPEYVFLAAAKVGGINANIHYPAELLFENVSIQLAVINAAALTGVKRLILFSSSCVYPEDCAQPMVENQVLKGSLEPNIEPSAIAKIAGMKLCEAYNRQYGTCFLSVIPPTLYGPNDNFDEATSHVLGALIGKFHRSKLLENGTVTIWGTGSPRREFLYSYDLAEACLFLMSLERTVLDQATKRHGWVVNVGSGHDMTIWELALIIKQTVGYSGEIVKDLSRPDGAQRKLLDSSIVNDLGWKPTKLLSDGLKETNDWYRVKSDRS